MLAGNVVALLSPLIFIPILTLIFGVDNYDYESMRAIRKGDDHDIAAEAHVDLELIPGERAGSNGSESEELEQKNLEKAAKIARLTTVAMTLILLVLWPFPLYGTGYIFSKKFFTGWVSVGIIWLFFSMLCVGVYPLWEGRHDIVHTIKSIGLDIQGKRSPAIQGRMANVHDEKSVEEIGEKKLAT